MRKVIVRIYMYIISCLRSSVGMSGLTHSRSIIYIVSQLVYIGIATLEHGNEKALNSYFF
ncbi:MAG: hypothetical protein B6I26_00540 [Desulfobacteraceae bacterium 4572_130]|nr:MAG: hypothetical protein B6I26_00540 [Desulfobacteraceae bacterium 4572_130]